MAIRINGQTYYRTLEACQGAGISRATLFRWLKVGILEDIMFRDRKGWRLFTKDDISRIKSEATRVSRGEHSLKK
jgi:predicted site-specific integrase-resolvase